MSVARRPRVGLIGLGNIGHHHAAQLEALDADLVGGLDIDETARTRFEASFGAPAYEDADALYEVADAVVITTPNRFHEEYAVSALNAGLDVLLEKPLAHSLESADRIASTATKADGFCMVGFNNRFSNAAKVIKDYQREGRFGEITHIEANYIRQRGIPGRGSWFTNKDIAGGGALIDLGVHAIDLALYFLDYPKVVEVAGATRSQFGGRDDYTFVEMWGKDAGPADFNVDDSVSAFIRCTEGRTISLEVAWATNRPTNDEFIIRGTEAGAKFDRGTHELTLYEAGFGGLNHLIESTVTTQQSNTHQAEQAVFLEGVRTGEHPDHNTVEEGITVQRVIDAIYRSSESSQTVALQNTAKPIPNAD
ncbi:Gfo/Idh/MocA family protein [Halegenticoccus soli]|uniref:Gfo/Idh/MocA family protein n=1 Tax=Halegenticoccus soli TaxID=1985678 RepID=UPI000C6CE5ED|nr:Gfo/Idh/MocA family oxidoreductase [Halegenticoccus soli]